jgi:hypothetical protein
VLKVESLVCTVEMIGPSRSAGAGWDALPRVRRCTSRRFFLVLLRRALALLELRLLPSASPVLSLHLFWTCGAGSRRSASLPGHAASNEENSTRLRGAQSHKSTADPTADPSDPRRRLVRPLSNQISALHSGRPTLLILRPLCYLCYLLFKSFCFPSVEIFAALL